MTKAKFCEVLDGVDELGIVYFGKASDWAKLSRPGAQIKEEYNVYVDLGEPKPRLPPGATQRNYNPISLNFHEYINYRDFIRSIFPLNSFKVLVSKVQVFYLYALKHGILVDKVVAS